MRTIQYRRKREGKTNYKKRLQLISSGKPRLVARITNSKIITQIVQFSPEGDKIIVGVDSTKVGKKKNIPTAYETGKLIAQKAQEKGIKEAVFDLGLRTSLRGSKIYAVLKGAVDGGLDIPHDEVCFPSQERIEGKHIKE